MNAAKKKPTSKVTKKKAVAKKPRRKVEAVPARYGTASPHLIVSPAKEAIALYAKAFGAKALMVMDAGPVVMHAELKIGDSIVMLSDEQPPMPGRPANRKTPKSAGATTGGIMLYVKDVDLAHARAVAAGFSSMMPPMDMFWGDRYCQLEDPFGHVWSIATHKVDMTPKQMKAAMQAAMAAPAPSA